MDEKELKEQLLADQYLQAIDRAAKEAFDAGLPPSTIMNLLVMALCTYADKLRVFDKLIPAVTNLSNKYMALMEEKKPTIH